MSENIVEFATAWRRRSQVRESLETITPEIASRMLEKIDPAKAEDKAAIRAYAAAMRKGGWIFNGMPIIFDKDDRVLDGVQRLNACIVTGEPFTTVVMRNADASIVHTIDQHRKRSYVGVLESRGVKHAGTVARAMTRMIRIDNGLHGKTRGVEISWSRLEAVLDANPEINEGVRISMDYSSGSALKKSARPTFAIMAVAANHKKQVREFLHILQNPDDYGPGPAKTLAGQFLAAEDSEGPGISVEKYLALAILAFNDFISGKNNPPSRYVWKPDMTIDKAKRQEIVKQKRDRLKARKVVLTKSEEESCMPDNLGLPRMVGYEGLRESRFVEERDRDLFSGRYAEELVSLRGSREAGEDDVFPATITPEVAVDILGTFNNGNRKVQGSHVEMIASDIRNGFWMENLQPICFAGDPELPRGPDNKIRLLNGQHRLEACSDADAPIEVFIAKNIPEEAFATYDIHAKQSTLRGLAGVKRVDERNLNAAAKIQWREDNGYPLTAGGKESHTPSASQIRLTVKKHPGMLEHHTQARRLKQFGSPGVMLYFLYRIHRERPELAEEFLEQMIEGAGLARDNPVLKSRQLILDIRKSGTNRNKALNELVAAWNAFVEYRDPGSSEDDQMHLRLVGD